MIKVSSLFLHYSHFSCFIRKIQYKNKKRKNNEKNAIQVKMLQFNISLGLLEVCEMKGQQAKCHIKLAKKTRKLNEKKLQRKHMRERERGGKNKSKKSTFFCINYKCTICKIDVFTFFTTV